MQNPANSLSTEFTCKVPWCALMIALRDDIFSERCHLLKQFHEIGSVNVLQYIQRPFPLQLLKCFQYFFYPAFVKNECGLALWA